MLKSIKTFWYNYIWKPKTPWADISHDGEKLVVNAYNKAFVEKQRQKLGDLSDRKTDDEVVQLFTDRDHLKREEPKLEVLHYGITEDGRVKMKLDWNHAFITHLHENGFSGETEEEVVQAYLQQLTAKVGEEMEHEPQTYTRDQIEDAFSEVSREADKELEAAKKQLRQANQLARRAKKNAK